MTARRLSGKRSRPFLREPPTEAVAETPFSIRGTPSARNTPPSCWWYSRWPRAPSPHPSWRDECAERAPTGVHIW